MSEPIGVGDWVECVDASPGRHGFSLQKGAIYRVARIFQSREIWGGRVHDEGALRLYGDPAPHGFSWRHHRFRPIYRPKQSIIEALKAPQKRVKEPA